MGPKAFIQGVLLAFLVLFAGTASAQGGSDRAAAVTAYKQAQTHYDLGEYDAAVAGYQKAYRLSKKPELLFNIAQAHRLAGNTRDALRLYRSFLRARPASPNRGDVEGFIAKLETAVAAENTKKKRRAAEASERGQRAREAEERRAQHDERERAFRLDQSVSTAKRRRRLRRSAAVVGASGVVVAGVGVVFTLIARSSWNDINELADNRGQWSDEFANKYSVAERNELIGAAGVGIGAAALVTSGVLYVISRGGSEQPRVAVVPAGKGARVVWQW